MNHRCLDCGSRNIESTPLELEPDATWEFWVRRGFGMMVHTTAECRCLDGEWTARSPDFPFAEAKGATSKEAAETLREILGGAPKVGGDE